MTLDLIVTGTRPVEIVRYAADELARYAVLLFGYTPRIAETPEHVAGATVSLDASLPSVAGDLSEQGYVIRKVEDLGQNLYQVAGGSPVATMWAVYDLVERWGVRFTLSEDILPDRPAALSFPDKPLACEPDLKLRVFRTYNNFANNPCQWRAADYAPLIDQLAKMRINGILMVARPSDPIPPLAFRGVEKSLATVSYGWRFPIKPGHPGYQLFEKSGDAQRGEFANPDFFRCASKEEALEQGTAYFQRIFEKAHQRGMKCLLSFSFTDCDSAIKQRLLELTKPEDKSPPSMISRVKLGVLREGPDIEVGRCMNIRNPVYRELMSTIVQAYLDAVPDADIYVLGTTEFGGPAADSEPAWAELDRKYGLSQKANLNDLIKEARENAEDNADRSERELRSDIVALYLLDYLINERKFDMSKTRENAQIVPGALSPELHQFLPVVLPRGSHYVASMGYMPIHVAKRMPTLQLSDPSAVHISVVTSLEDDNIGLVPQLTGPAVQSIVEALRAAGGYGVTTRQWLHSNLLPTLHYLAHASWERGWQPETAYEHLFSGICGEQAVPHLLDGFRIIEELTEMLYSRVICLSFPVPYWITNLWYAKKWPQDRSPDQMLDIAATYKRASEKLKQAITASKPAGRAYLQSIERHVAHAVHYAKAIATLASAYAHSQAAEDAREASQFDRLDRESEAAAQAAKESAQLMRKACETFAEGVMDRVDLGALAALNTFNLDAVEAIEHLVGLRSAMFSCTEHPETSP